MKVVSNISPRFVSDARLPKRSPWIRLQIAHAKMEMRCHLPVPCHCAVSSSFRRERSGQTLRFDSSSCYGNIVMTGDRLCTVPEYNHSTWVLMHFPCILSARGPSLAKIIIKSSPRLLFFASWITLPVRLRKFLLCFSSVCLWSNTFFYFLCVVRCLDVFWLSTLTLPLYVSLISLLRKCLCEVSSIQVNLEDEFRWFYIYT